jgi:hypothetical protein
MMLRLRRPAAPERSAAARLVVALAALLCLAARPARSAELFVADRATNRVLSFDEATGKFLRIVASAELAEPSGMTFGPGGFLYVTNVVSGAYPGSPANVVKINPVTGEATPFISGVVNGPGGIAYDPTSDSLFVSEFGNFDGDEVFRFDAAGNLIQTIGTGSPATARSGMSIDAAGNLYVSELNFPGQFARVLKYTAASNYATESTFASGQGVNWQYPAPPTGFNGLAFDDLYGLFVSSLVGQAVAGFPLVNGTPIGGAQFGPPVAYPSGLLINPAGELLVSSLGNNNPADPFYGPLLFPGTVLRYHLGTTGVTPLLVGDLNRDAAVTADDLAVLQAALAGTPNVSGDLDGDRDADGADVLRWQQGLGNQGVAGPLQPTAMARYEPVVVGAGATPEPSALALAAMGTSILVLRRLRASTTRQSNP